MNNNNNLNRVNRRCRLFLCFASKKIWRQFKFTGTYAVMTHRLQAEFLSFQTKTNITSYPRTNHISHNDINNILKCWQQRGGKKATRDTSRFPYMFKNLPPLTTISKLFLFLQLILIWSFISWPWTSQRFGRRRKRKKKKKRKTEQIKAF